MREIAQLIRADVGLEAAATEANLGWDLHSDLGTPTDGNMRNAVEALSDVLAAFFVDLGALGDRVTVCVMTEFGRTFRENGNGGTDHGRASTMFVAGGGIRGGLYGDWPGLADADIDRNALRVTVDYRYVLADIVQHRLANPDLGTVFPGFVADEAQRLNLADPLVAPAPVETLAAPVVVTTPEPEPADEEQVEEVAEEGPAPVTSGPGTYVWTSPDGGVVHLDVPAPADEADVVAIDAARASLGGAAATYVLARLDNSVGTAPLNVPTVAITSSNGAPLALREASALVDEWVAAAADGSDDAAALADSLRGRGRVDAGGSGQVVLAATGAVTEIASVRAGTPGSSVVLAHAVAAPEVLEASSTADVGAETAAED